MFKMTNKSKFEFVRASKESKHGKPLKVLNPFNGWKRGNGRVESKKSSSFNSWIRDQHFSILFIFVGAQAGLRSNEKSFRF